MGTIKKAKELKIIDGKTAQNISILLTGNLKYMKYDDIKKCIFKCDEEILTETIVDRLIQVLLIYREFPFIPEILFNFT